MVVLHCLLILIVLRKILSPILFAHEDYTFLQKFTKDIGPLIFPFSLRSTSF